MLATGLRRQILKENLGLILLGLECFNLFHLSARPLSPLNYCQGDNPDVNYAVDVQDKRKKLNAATTYLV